MAANCVVTASAQQKQAAVAADGAVIALSQQVQASVVADGKKATVATDSVVPASAQR